MGSVRSVVVVDVGCSVEVTAGDEEGPAMPSDAIEPEPGGSVAGTAVAPSEGGAALALGAAVAGVAVATTPCVDGATSLGDGRRSRSVSAADEEFEVGVGVGLDVGAGVGLGLGVGWKRRRRAWGRAGRRARQPPWQVTLIVSGKFWIA